jgi:hypothetical protein
MPDKDGKYTAIDFYRQEGVKDIVPMAARGAFAKALAVEANAGKTTPEAEKFLEQAIGALS